MSASVMGLSPDSPRDMSPDTSSPYPDRPIRPLPKKPLRERLSPDVAQSIKYPPAPKITTPLFYYGYNSREDEGSNGLMEPQHPSERERAAEVERNYISRRNGDDLDSEDDEHGYRSRIVYQRHSALDPIRSYRYVQKPDSKHSNPQPPRSTASSADADSYDSFENTNNKKKRKIPTPGDSSLNGVHLSSDLAGMGISGPEDLAEDVGPGVYQSPGFGQGISGPGRGRYGRIRNGRSPLRTLSDASSNWGNGRTPKHRLPQWPLAHESTGIISESIATANAEKLPITPSSGQENVSILQQASNKKTSPASTQFTFTCDSQVPGTVPWPGPTDPNPMHHISATTKTMASHATQTMTNGPSTNGVPSALANAKQGLAASQNSKQAAPQLAPPKKGRPGREYLIAARQRRLDQKWKNEHQPIPKEDQWTCEFCEYEQIFGKPPVALIRQYEIKDRQARKVEAERKRLLDKAKMKGRKGKKGGKAVKPVPQPYQPPPPRHAPTNNSQSDSRGTQSDEFEDEYEDDYAQENPPPSPTPVTNNVPRADLKKGSQGGAHNSIPPT